MITIHYNFTNGTEVSYAEGLRLKDNFYTNCLDFFETDNEATDVIIMDYSGNIISRNALMKENNIYTTKKIRKEHNILKMFKANSFNWR